ncbi:MAG: glycosyltransferase family 2 protein [Acidobacteria bacterium]|nr:glycosyltransferase family 2 protein [Acidobacteriota bacterium]
MARVSVIIATRNRCALLPRAVESARHAGAEVEIVVVDDASDDGTREVCEAWLDVRYIRARRRLGPGGARNVGIVAGTSEYVSFLDDDDVRLPGSLDAQVGLLEARPDSGMVYGRVLYGDEECRPGDGFYPERCPQGDIFRELLSWNFIPCPSVVFRRSCLRRVGLLDEEAFGLEDWDLWVRIAELYPVLAVEEAVAVWRRPSPESGQFTSRPERMHRVARRLHAEKWLRLPRPAALGGGERRRLNAAFAERAAGQLVAEIAERFKAGRPRDSVRVARALFGMYPVRASRKVAAVAVRWWLKTARQVSRTNEPGGGKAVP